MSDSAPVVIGGPYPVLDCLHPRELATFYCELLGWEVADDDAGVDDPGWVGLRSPDGQQMMSLQREARYEAPTWPADGTHQQMMIHLDFQVADLDAALAKAVELGASLTPWQPQADVRVCTDPAGHVLCLFE
jgi:predicted enzyme related to lactoylglutathione lyase